MLIQPEQPVKKGDKHGVKTIVIARFMPIIRTFALFIAGIALVLIVSSLILD